MKGDMIYDSHEKKIVDTSLNQVIDFLPIFEIDFCFSVSP